MSAVVGLVMLVGCASGPEVIVKTADGRGLSAEDVDRQPRALLPGGGFAWAHVDVVAARASTVGQRLLEWAEARVPVPPEAGFSAQRDLERVLLAAYAAQGLDIAGVATGRFDAERIRAVAERPPSGATTTVLAASEYAGRTLYTTQGAGFVVLTPRTLLFGSERSMRRTLDRIEEGRVADELPDWARSLLDNPRAHFVTGFDLVSEPATASVSRRLGFLRGAEQARLLGNFEPPGLNVAGTITYVDAAAAAAGAEDLRRGGSNAAVAARLLGLGEPIRKLEARSIESHTELVVSLDESALGKALALLARIERP